MKKIEIISNIDEEYSSHAPFPSYVNAFFGGLPGQ